MKQANNIRQVIKEVVLFVTCGLIPGGYDDGATFTAMQIKEDQQADIVSEIEFLLDTNLDGLVIEATMTPATLEKVLVKKFGKETE